MRVSAAIPGGRLPGNPRATHGNGTGFVAKLCPRAWGNRVPGQTSPGTYRFANDLAPRWLGSVSSHGCLDEPVVLPTRRRGARAKILVHVHGYG